MILVHLNNLKLSRNNAFPYLNMKAADGSIWDCSGRVCKGQGQLRTLNISNTQIVYNIL